MADAEPTTCSDGTASGVSCYTVADASGTDGVRVRVANGDTIVIPIGDAPVVNIDSGASTSAASNVDLRVDIDIASGNVVRIERRIDPVRQLALVTLAALLGLFVGAAVLGTFLRFRRGPRT